MKPTNQQRGNFNKFDNNNITPLKRNAPTYSALPPSTRGLGSDFARIDKVYVTKKPKHSVTDSGPPKILSSSAVKAQKDYLIKYENLIRWEIEDQMKAFEQRMNHTDKNKLIREGSSLFDMKASFKGFLFNEALITFRPNGDKEMPYHKFTHGDMVMVTTIRNGKTLMFDGVVAEKNKMSLVVSTTTTIEIITLSNCLWRLDQSANRVTFDRMLSSLTKFCSSDGEKLTNFKDLILGKVKSVKESAKQLPPQWLLSCYSQSNWPRDFNSWKLNQSQQEVLKDTLQHRLTIIQGPPGTGKTHTAVHLVKLLVHCLKKHNKKVHILCTADTNVAVDNLLEGLTDQGVKALRVGKPVKIREELRNLCLEAQLEEHPHNIELNNLCKERDTLTRHGPSHNIKQINSLKQNIRIIEAQMSRDVIDKVDVVCATCIGASGELLDNFKFPVVLIDECTQATEPAALCALVRGSEHVILLGDHFQLPPTITSDRAKQGGLGVSIFERLINQGVESKLLQIQYRMHPLISAFPSQEFYDGQIKDGITSTDREVPKGFPWPDNSKPVAFVPTDGKEQTSVDGVSKHNVTEAKLILKLIDNFLASGLSTKEIGIITPYNGQVQLLKNMFDSKGGLSKGEKYHKLTIHSVDGFQGREKEIILFSAVRANDSNNVGFLRDWRRLNVALTRARSGIIVLGHQETLESDPHWKKWVDWVNENNLTVRLNNQLEAETLPPLDPEATCEPEFD